MKTNAKLKDIVIKLLYKLINNFFYFNDFKKKMRLCVLTKILKHEVFKLVYDEMRYFDYVRIHEKLIRNIYIFNVFIKLHKYLRHYFHY